MAVSKKHWVINVTIGESLKIVFLRLSAVLSLNPQDQEDMVIDCQHHDHFLFLSTITDH